MDINDFPLTLKTRDVAKIMGISLPKVYDVMRHPGFPVIRDNRLIVIPRDAFFRWLNDESFQNVR